MLFLNTNRIMPNMIGLLSFLSVTVPIVNATPIVSQAVSKAASLAPRADPGFILNARRDNAVEAIDGVSCDTKALEGTVDARDGEIIETRDGTINRRGDFCHHADPGYCTIAITVTPSRLAEGKNTDMVYLWDNSCRQIGGMFSGQDIDMASQLPYKIVGHMAFNNQRLTAFPEFCYAGRFSLQLTTTLFA
ncbi:hypothetical protein BTUL_0013g00510 [Botrytis tulipae]|uniref:Ecp2 effector protein domain-containing protein n=1 Tax=Botrytis tulipae TaxID=87230 RepID=A0A4Z1F3H9_9HELO|nr:hypothetical protein BTUL_0013g00510 [Botrytis tulipae]